MTLSKGKHTYYIPGGKRQAKESDLQCLTREIKEELSVNILPNSVKYYGHFQAQAHGKSKGIMVHMICYQAEFSGELKPSSEITNFTFYDYSKRDIIEPVDQLIFDYLSTKNLIK